jgi:hypothetical protein
VVVITADKVAAIGAQKSRIDDLATLLDKTTTIAAVIELLDGIRQLEAWKNLAASSDKLASVGDFIGVLGDGVKQLHAFQAGLKDASVRLGNIQGELDAILKDSGAAKQLADIRAQVSTELRAAVATLQDQTTATIQKVLIPIRANLSDVGDLVIGACAMAKLSGGTDQLRDLCARAKDVFTQANAFLADLDKRPGELFTSVTTKLEASLDTLIDDQSKQLIATAQQAVNDALKLPGAPGPATGAGSGSGSGSGAVPNPTR